MSKREELVKAVEEARAAWGAAWGAAYGADDPAAAAYASAADAADAALIALEAYDKENTK